MSIDLPLAMLGGNVRVLASGVGDIAGPAEAALVLQGASVLPPSPVHVRAERGADGSVVLRWVRRSRAGWRWIDHVDAPLGEEREDYRVTITPATGAAQTILTDVPVLAVAAGDPGSGITRFSVAQRGSCGESMAASLDLVF